jgi:serine/threonine protein kinase
MEYVSCGELLSFVRKRSKLNENIARFIFRQIIEALQYIHSQNIVHRDIKLDNILIDLQSNIKICDFGVSKSIRKNDVMHDQCGTPAYIAPEILKNCGYEGFGVDIWSAGVVLYAILSGTVPFKANNMKDLHKCIIKGSFNKISDISDGKLIIEYSKIINSIKILNIVNILIFLEAGHLISNLLEVDPKKRITVEQILMHPWIRERNKLNKLPLNLNLFTEAETIILTKSNVDYRFAPRDDLKENFTLRNIDTAQETENQNIGTKSVILAPFNSSLISDDNFLNRELTIENEVVKFCGKVRELNRNYELNNNGEIDNGIIISPIDKGSKASNDNYNENTPIYSPQCQSPFNNSFINPNKIKSKPTSPPELDEEIRDIKEIKDVKALVKNGNNLHSVNSHLSISKYDY